ncbi:MAG: APC family permease [Candidatus Methylacidiphilales bacterium]
MALKPMSPEKTPAGLAPAFHSGTESAAIAATTPEVTTFKVPLTTAIWIVVANMIGTGVFTSLGYQLFFTSSPFVVMMLWLVGGGIALCGALAYAELAAALPRSGGEFHFLSRIYHPAVGFVAGWTSVTVGFAAPIALSAIALSGYSMSAMGYIPVRVAEGQAPTTEQVLVIQQHEAIKDRIAIGVVVAITLAQLWSLRVASAFQAFFTVIKLLIILALIVAGMTITPIPQKISFMPGTGDWSQVMSASFASNLYWVMYAYSGWNAATYIIDEVKDPARNLPRALLWGTLCVMLLYILLNSIFLYVAPMSSLRGVQNVATPAALAIFGDGGARIVSGIICFGLIATISAMTWVGPRVSKAMGEKVPVLSFFAITNKNNIPYVAILIQCGITLCLLHLGTMNQIMQYIQFTLTLSSTLTVIGLFVLRLREPELERPYKAWGYPVTPIFFIACSIWMLYVSVEQSPKESLWGFVTMIAGLIVFYSSQAWTSRKRQSSVV